MPDFAERFPEQIEEAVTVVTNFIMRGQDSLVST